MNIPHTICKAASTLITGSFFLLNALATHAVVDATNSQNTAAVGPAPPSFVSDRIIVKYADNVPANQVSILSSSEVSSLSSIANVDVQHMRKIATGAHLVKLQKKANRAQINQIVQDLMANPNIEYAEIDQLLQPLAIPSDPRYNEQWHYFESAGGLNLPNAWDVSTGLEAVVGVIDTGYRPHADLTASLLPGYDMISDTFVSRDGDGRDNDASDPGDWSSAGECSVSDPGGSSSWHGTHVAGTIAAAANNGIGVAGVAYNAKIVPIRALGRCGGYTSDIADGIIWGAGGSVSGTPSNPHPAQVLNLSLGGGGACSATTQDAINTARSLGTTVVVAAGNSNTNASNANPANCNGVIAVASVGRDGGRAFYSNFGAVVDVAAPGGETNITSANGVLSTLNSGSQSPGGDNYAFYQGTSMAAPHVAGVAALLYAKNFSITPDEVETILKDTARAFPATCSQCGAGIVDATASLNASINGTPTPLPGNSELVNNVPATNLSGAAGDELLYTINVPTAVNSLTFTMSGGSGDADIYVRFGSEPTTSTYDCRPYLNSSNEACDITSPQAGTYYVMIRGYSSFSGLSLVGSYAEGVARGSFISENSLSASRLNWLHFPVEVAAGSSLLAATISGGSGDADLYVNYGSEPSVSSYDCRPYTSGSSESCNISNPRAGTWYVSVRAFQAFSGLTLNAESN